jgi:nucleotide-binding universal stress UspA family protein
VTTQDEQPIVVGVDGSAGADEALRWALAEAACRGRRLVALAAWSWLDQPGKFNPDYGESDVEKATRASVERAREQVADAKGVDVEVRAVNDHPARALIDASASASLLVVGSRGLGGFKQLMLGSVSSQCVHHAHCPVVVVRGSHGRPDGEPDHGRDAGG